VNIASRTYLTPICSQNIPDTLCQKSDNINGPSPWALLYHPKIGWISYAPFFTLNSTFNYSSTLLLGNLTEWAKRVEEAPDEVNFASSWLWSSFSNGGPTKWLLKFTRNKIHPTGLQWTCNLTLQHTLTRNTITFFKKCEPRLNITWIRFYFFSKRMFRRIVT